MGRWLLRSSVVYTTCAVLRTRLQINSTVNISWFFSSDYWIRFCSFDCGALWVFYLIAPLKARFFLSLLTYLLENPLLPTARMALHLTAFWSKLNDRFCWRKNMQCFKCFCLSIKFTQKVEKNPRMDFLQQLSI